MNNSILIVDPSAQEAELLKTILESAGFGYRCGTVAGMEALPAAVAAAQAEVLLVDLDLLDDPAWRRLNKLKRENRGLRVYVLAREVTPEQYRRAQEHALDGFCQKDDDYPAMIDSIEQTIT